MLLVALSLSFVGNPVSALQELLNSPALQGGLSCVCVIDHQGKVVLDHNGNLRATPASNNKLFSAAYALHTLGAQFKPTLAIYKEGNTITLKTEGFPTASYHELQAAALKVGADKGCQVFVSQAYGPLYPPGWELDDMPNPYANSINALMVDKGGYAVWAGEGKIEFKPESFGATYDYQPTDEKVGWKFDPFHKKLKVWGKLPAKFAELDTLAIPYPHLAAASLFGQPVGLTAGPPKGDPALSLTGPELTTILRDELFPSNNIVAESTLLLSAHHAGIFDAQTHEDDIYPKATKALKSFLVKEVGIAGNDIDLADGSGESRHNVTTPRAIAKLLRYEMKNGFANLLPAPGEGTLKHRLKGVKVRAKTGSLDGAVALSGYLQTEKHDLLIFSVLLNNYAGSDSEARQAVDKFITRLSRE